MQNDKLALEYSLVYDKLTLIISSLDMAVFLM